MVAAQLQQWTTEEKRMAQLPLFLDGDAFLMWDELSDEDKKKENSVKQRLRDAFTLSTGQAYGQLVTRTLGRAESVDAYAADLRRLLIAAGHKVEADKSPMLIEQFIRGLPSTEANQLTSNGDTSSIGACVAYVRRLRTSVSHMSGGVSAVAASSVESLDEDNPVQCCASSVMKSGIFHGTARVKLRNNEIVQVVTQVGVRSVTFAMRRDSSRKIVPREKHGKSPAVVRHQPLVGTKTRILTLCVRTALL